MFLNKDLLDEVEESSSVIMEQQESTSEVMKGNTGKRPQRI